MPPANVLRITTIKQVAPRLRYHKQSNALTPAEKAGQWLGSGCAVAGVARGQPVEIDDLGALLSGYHADSGAFLGQRRDPRRRAGWDVCLSVHKSVSAAGLCGPTPLRDSIRAAYDEAVRGFTAALEALACHCTGGHRPVETNCLIVAAFTHERSRRDDPHLHTHYIVVNATWDGMRWRALEPARFFRCNTDLDRAFQRELLRALRARSIEATLDRKGRVVIPSVPHAACLRLSSAKHAIDQALATPDTVLHSPSTLHREAAAALINDRLRPKKKPLEEARSFDRMLTPEELERLMRLRPTAPRPEPPAPPRDDVLKAVRRQAARRSAFLTPRSAFAAAVAAATYRLVWPLIACLDAAKDVSRQPWARSPWLPTAPQHQTAAQQLSERAAHARQAAAHAAAQRQQQQLRRVVLARQQQQAAAQARAFKARQYQAAAAAAAARRRRAHWQAAAQAAQQQSQAQTL